MHTPKKPKAFYSCRHLPQLWPEAAQAVLGLTPDKRRERLKKSDEGANKAEKGSTGGFWRGSGEGLVPSGVVEQDVWLRWHVRIMNG